MTKTQLSVRTPSFRSLRRGVCGGRLPGRPIRRRQRSKQENANVDGLVSASCGRLPIIFSGIPPTGTRPSGWEAEEVGVSEGK
jgi:hypothetical protein